MIEWMRGGGEEEVCMFVVLHLLGGSGGLQALTYTNILDISIGYFIPRHHILIGYIRMQKSGITSQYLDLRLTSLDS